MGRERWKSSFGFILAAVGSAVGLGNIWRFPYLAGKYGGGAFLLVYVILLFIIGIPLLLVEYGFGQRMQKGVIRAFESVNIRFRGLGLAALGVGFAVSTYYTVIMAWILLYFFSSFTLAWGDDTVGYFTQLVNVGEPGMIGSISIITLLALLAVWVIIYFSVWRGISSIERIIKYILFIPFAILLILLARGFFLPGAFDGLSYFLRPDFSALLQPELWAVAVSQLFFSLSIGFGVMITFASFERKAEDITKNAIVIALADSLIAIVGGLVVFSTLGFMAQTSSSSLESLAASGPNLAFIVFPQALSLLPYAQIFAGLFFITLFLLALSSEISMISALQTALQEKYPHLSRVKGTMVLCFVLFVLGIAFTTASGLYILDIVDHFVVEYGLLVVGLLEVLVVAWFFGAEKLRQFINRVSTTRIPKIVTPLLKYVIPVVIFLLIVHQLVLDITAPYSNYSQWMIAVFGWCGLAVLFVLSIVFSFSRR